ncbi:MAG: hypothetical protein J1F42_00290 [Lachnospiraceae bacterium]|nr:hypothetical protein [Lachnospiraceae bacterium]
MIFQDFNVTYAATCLTVLSILLIFALYIVQYRTVRIYNWNGDRYCYLGRAVLRHNGGGYQVRIGERMADLSYTTLYQVCPSKGFVRRNRYSDMMLCAGRAKSLLHMEECMRKSIYYKRGTL